MSDQLPRTPEEFQLWMVEKVGEIHTSQAAMAGDLKVAMTEHRALKDRVKGIEAEARSAKHWENGKILGLALIHAAANALKIHI